MELAGSVVVGTGVLVGEGAEVAGLLAVVAEVAAELCAAGAAAGAVAGDSAAGAATPEFCRSDIGRDRSPS
jgi:hypothetical protein